MKTHMYGLTRRCFSTEPPGLTGLARPLTGSPSHRKHASCFQCSTSRRADEPMTGLLLKEDRVVVAAQAVARLEEERLRDEVLLVDERAERLAAPEERPP